MKKYVRIHIRVIISLLAVFIIHSGYAQVYVMRANTVIVPPVNPVINQAYAVAGMGIRVNLIRVPGGDSSLFVDNLGLRLKISGKLERISNAHFSIEVDPSYIPIAPRLNFFFTIPTYTLTQRDFENAFGLFDEKYLKLSGIAIKDIFQAGGIYRLPEGLYRICFTVLAELRAPTGGPTGTYKNISNPESGCAVFSICYTAGSAPQFIQPVNNLNINSAFPVVRPSSPLVFTWTPPQSNCGQPPGGYKYDFEIREIFDNQTVSDAVLNPYVFRKISLPSTTFLLDTNLYKNVLQQGKRYAIRVKASNVSIRDTFSIDNNGYSRVEAFQYGSRDIQHITPYNIQPPQFYYLPSGDRKTNMWDDIYSAYLNHTRGDTVIPLKEYIAFTLTENGIAYNLNAIELFLALNPELASLKEIKLSKLPRLPQFPQVTETDQRKFDEDFNNDLKPDLKEVNRFRKYLDSLNAFMQPSADSAVTMLRNIIPDLENFNKKVHTVNRVSANLVNNLLSELLYALRFRMQKTGKSESDRLRDIVSNIGELIRNSSEGTSLIIPVNTRKNASLSSYNPPEHYSVRIPQNSDLIPDGIELSGAYLPVERSLLPLNVIVWRGSTEQPSRPVLNTPDLKNVYRIFYTTPALYNNKNPEINAVSIPRLASTAPVSLPKLSRFKFWSLNMLNHKVTNAEDIETSDVFLLNSKNKWPDSKKIYVVLKVE